MPLTRCRNFDDDGNEIRGGCPLRSNCEFIHPTDPKWTWARAYVRNSVRGRGRGRGGGRGRGRGDADASWGHPPIVISKGADSTFDSHSRGEASTSASSAITARSEGTGSLPVASDNSDAQIASGWGSGQGSGWGGDMADSGWGNTGTSGNNGWGDSGGNGWGSTGDTGWGSTGDNEGSRKNSGWGSTRGTKDAGGTTPSPSPAATQRGEDETMNSSASAAFTETVKPIPLPSRKASSSHLQPPVSSKQITDPPHIPLKIRPMSLGDTVVPSPVIVPASARPRETLTRVQVYSNTIKNIQNAVRLQLQLETAQAAADRWKATQLSSQYSRASPATRKILNEKRADFSKDVVDIANRLKLALVALSDLPDLSTASGKTFPDVDENQIMEYTAQLKDWIGKLQLGSRIVPPSPPTENRPLRPQDGQPWTWEHIKESFTELERSAENVAEQIYIKKFTHMMDIMDPNEKIAALLDAHRKREHGEAALAADVLLRNVDEVGNELGKQAMLAAQLFLKVQHNEEELEKLRDEKRQRDAMKSSIEGYFKKFDEWRQEDSAQIQQLTDQIINLHTLRHPTPPLLDIENIRPKIRELVINKLENEVVPVIDHFRSACKQNNECFIKGLYKKLKPTLDLTTDICCRAREEVASSEAT